MLTLLLRILGIVGIILLVVLGIVLALVLLVLFFPVTYKIAGERKPSGEPPSALMALTVKVNWLFGLLRVRFLYPDPGMLTVKVLFFTVFRSNLKQDDDQPGKKDSDKKGASKKKKRRPKSNDTVETDSSSESVIDLGEEANGGSGPGVESDPGMELSPGEYLRAEEEDTAEQAVTDEPRKSIREKIEVFFEKIKAKITEIRDKISNIRNKADHYREIFLCDDTRALLDHALLRLGKILKSVRPRKLKADLRFGTGSPDTTGYILGVYGMFSPYLGKHVRVTPDFEQATLEGDFYAAGHLIVCKLLWHALRLFFDRRFRGLIRKLKDKE